MSPLDIAREEKAAHCMEPEGSLNLALDDLEKESLPVTQPAEVVEPMVSRRAMNSTAYRIFKLLQWLIESPLSVEALNRLFCADPRIGKPVSSDSIWLYVNTLKALGCRIRRPSPRNNFQYEMLSHPFGLILSHSHLETLAQAKAFAQQKLNHQEIRVLDGLLKKIVAFSDCENPGETIEQLFSQSRSFDYEHCGKHISQLEACVSEKKLLELTYLSPLRGKERFTFLPLSLFYEQGVLYVRGERPEFEEPSSLRIDRILEISAIYNAELSIALIDRGQQKVQVSLQILTNFPDRFEGLKLGENQGIFEETVTWIEEGSYYEIVLQVRDFFYLKQRLLACGFPFRIMTPSFFKEDVAQTLKTMLQFYQGNEEGAHGTHEFRS